MRPICGVEKRGWEWIVPALHKRCLRCREYLCLAMLHSKPYVARQCPLLKSQSPAICCFSPIPRGRLFMWVLNLLMPLLFILRAVCVLTVLMKRAYLTMRRNVTRIIFALFAAFSAMNRSHVT